MMQIIVTAGLVLLFMFGFVVILQAHQNIKTGFDARDYFLLVISLLLCAEQVYLMLKVFGSE